MKGKSLQWIRRSACLLASIAFAHSACAEGSDPLLQLLVKKGLLSEQEAKDLNAEAAKGTTPYAPAGSRFKLNAGITNMELFGDVRLRYEYREAQTEESDTLARQRWRYSVRVGLRGTLMDNFYYGVRLDTSTNPRSAWNTFGSETAGNPGPSSKNDDGIFIGQAYLGWKTTDWLSVEAGRMPNPLYTTAMVWDPDIAPEGLAEKFKFSVGDFDLFATFGQFIYQDVNPDNPATGIAGMVGPNRTDAFMLAWQVGANYKIAPNTSVKIAPALYNYTGHGMTPPGGTFPGYDRPYTGQGDATGANVIASQTGINNLLVVEVPGEVNFKVGNFNTRLFGDFAINLNAEDRAKNAGFAGYKDEDKAYQVGIGIGNLGLTSGQVAKKGTWEARAYWQHVEQYAVDVNLIDSDFFEGRANLQGIFAAVAYSFTDNLIGTFRYGYADRINDDLGTGGSNADLPQINPINKYQLFQVDLTWKF